MIVSNGLPTTDEAPFSGDVLGEYLGPAGSSSEVIIQGTATGTTLVIQMKSNLISLAEVEVYSGGQNDPK